MPYLNLCMLSLFLKCQQYASSIFNVIAFYSKNLKVFNFPTLMLLIPDMNTVLNCKNAVNFEILYLHISLKDDLTY